MPALIPRGDPWCWVEIKSQQRSTIADRGMINADSSTEQGLREALNPAAEYDCDSGTRMT